MITLKSSTLESSHTLLNLSRDTSIFQNKVNTKFTQAMHPEGQLLSPRLTTFLQLLLRNHGQSTSLSLLKIFCAQEIKIKLFPSYKKGTSLIRTSLKQLRFYGCSKIKTSIIKLLTFFAKETILYAKFGTSASFILTLKPSKNS